MTNDTEVTCEEGNSAMITSQRLGGLPLALVAVGHFVAARGSSYTEFIQNYGESFSYDGLTSQWDKGLCHQNIITIFTPLLQRLSKKASEIILALAILDPDCVPLSIFRVDKQAMSDQSIFRNRLLMLTVYTGCIMARTLKMSCLNFKIGSKAQPRILTSEHDAWPITPSYSS